MLSELSTHVLETKAVRVLSEISMSISCCRFKKTNGLKIAVFTLAERYTIWMLRVLWLTWLTRQFAANGMEPRTTDTCLIFNQIQEWNLSRYASFAMEHGRSIGHVEFHRVKEIMDKVNSLAAAAQELTGVSGCTKDRVHGCPPWFCCLPVICCLGGCCILAIDGKKKIKKLTSDINQELDAANQSGIFKPYEWRLCASAHKSTVHDTDDGGGGGRRTHTSVVCWIELADRRADHGQSG